MKISGLVVLTALAVAFPLTESHSQTVAQLQRRLANVEKQAKALTQKTNSVAALASDIQADADDAKSKADQADALAKQVDQKASQLDAEVEAVGDATSSVKNDVDSLKRTLAGVLRGRGGTGSSWGGRTLIFGQFVDGFRTESDDAKVTFMSTSEDAGSFTSSPYLFFDGRTVPTDPNATFTGRYKVISDKLYLFSVKDDQGIIPAEPRRIVLVGSIEGDDLVVGDVVGERTIRLKPQAP